MDETCIICKKKLKIGKGDTGVAKRGVTTLIKSKTEKIPITESLHKSIGVTITPDKHVCNDCYGTVCNVHYIRARLSNTKKTFQEEKGKLLKSDYIKRRVSFSPSPLKKRIRFNPLSPILGACGPMSSTPVKQKRDISRTPRVTFKTRVIECVKYGNYDSAFRTLYNSSAQARKDIHKVLGQLVNKEIKSFSTKISTFRQELSLETIDKFSWCKVLKEFDEDLPLVSSMIRGSLTTGKTKEKISCSGRKIGPLVPTYGLLMGVILGKRKGSFKFLQQIISIQMYRSGCNHKLFKWFKKFGICLSVSATRALVDNIGKQYDRTANEWKQTIEEYVLGVRPKQVHVIHPYDDEDDSSVSEESMSDVSDMSGSEDSIVEESIADLSQQMEDTVLWSDDELTPLPDQSIIEPENVQGYSLCWDNVQKLSTARYESTMKTNKMLLWANCFAAKDRIPFSAIPCAWDKTRMASHIDSSLLLPNDDDWMLLRSRMEVIVQRLLVQLYELENIDVMAHIQHKYSELSSQKSEIVNLGIVKENPSTCRGVIEIMKYLHQYVPMDDNGEVWPLICHGDQLSVERMIDSKLAMYSGTTPTSKLQGLIPRPQNFHKRVILLQDTLDNLYGKGPCDKGTLTQIKNKFGHRNVKKKASECVNHLSDFLSFVTEGHLCLLTMKLLKTEEPQQHLTSTEEVQKLAKDVVSFIWPVIDEYEAEIEDSMYTCICNSDEDLGEWIECSSRQFCETRWFHKVCVNFDEDDDAEYDWWCNNDCKSKGKSGYCCRKQKDDAWVECKSGLSCVQNQWFHRHCVGHFGDDWYCSEACRLGVNTDHKQAYAMNVLWRGLTHLVEKDVERENDGDAMISMWKINMLEFWEYGHYKYLILGHRLLASVNGWMPERIVENLIWNSTANLRGEPGGNLPLDLINEFLNNEFKGNLKRLRGQYSDNAVHRCSLITGTVGKGIEDMFMSEVINKYVGRSGRKAPNHLKDITKFIAEYSGEKLFDCIPGRHHVAFSKFLHRIPVKKIDKLKERLTKYSTNLDVQRLMIH